MDGVGVGVLATSLGEGLLLGLGVSEGVVAVCVGVGLDGAGVGPDVGS